MLPPYQVIEQTINKDQKGAGGIIGNSTSTGTIQRWVLSSHNTAAFAGDLKKSLGLDTHGCKPKDLSVKRMFFDERSVAQCYETISSCVNPFMKSSKIVSLSSGVEANTEMEADLLNAGEIGKLCFDDFIMKRIESSEVDFYAPIKNKLATFDIRKKTSVTRLKGTESSCQFRQRNICQINVDSTAAECGS